MSDFLLSLKDVSLAFGGPPVLDRVSLSVSRGLRAALTGRNGEGKSTLMKVIAGMREADSGEIVRAPGLKVAYVGQDVSAIDGRSGGQSRRARLEEALLSQPDLLLLDEPTNHLDTEAIDWLEAMLKRMRDSAVLLVTHDRRFLRRVATSIFDLDRGELAGWPCDYTTFVKRKADLLADEAVYWERKSKKLREEEAWIRRGVKARTTRNEGRVAALKKLRAEFAARRARVGTATMRLDTAAPGGERVLKVEKLSFAYPGGRPIVSDFTADVLRGERIGILGRNGAGKTTLLRLIAKNLLLRTDIKAAYMPQDYTERMDMTLTPVEFLSRTGDKDELTAIRTYLGSMRYTAAETEHPIAQLSGGQKAKLYFIAMNLNRCDVLLLDEPTRNFSPLSGPVIRKALKEYGGTIISVSHDRKFIAEVCDRVYQLGK